MNDKLETVAIVTESLTTARNVLGVGPRTLEEVNGLHGPENRISGDRHHEAKASRMGRMQTAYFVEADVDPVTLDFVTVNGMRFVPAAQIAELIDNCRHEREHAGKSEAGRRVAEDRLADMTTNRNALDEACQRKDARIDQLVAGAHTSTAQIADLTTRLNQAGIGELSKTNPDAVETMLLAVADEARLHRMADPESWRANRQDTVAHVIRALAAQVADLTAERDAAAENVRRERNRADYLREALLGVRDDLHNENRLNTLSIADVIWHGSAETTVDYIDAALLVDGDKPRCRVVTSPRFYGIEEQRKAADAFDAWSQSVGFNVRKIVRLELVETIASALGMRRA